MIFLSVQHCITVFILNVILFLRNAPQEKKRVKLFQRILFLDKYKFSHMKVNNYGFKEYYEMRLQNLNT